MFKKRPITKEHVKLRTKIAWGWFYASLIPAGILAGIAAVFGILAFICVLPAYKIAPEEHFIMKLERKI